MKICCVNNRGSLLSNLWCFCSKSINLVLVNVDDQQINLKIVVNGKSFCLTGVYASNCQLKRKELWENLKNIQHSTNLPWCCLGEFNTILGVHEQRSRYRVSSSTMTYFQEWSEANNLIHIHTRGATYTWTNRRRGRFNIQRRLDRAICNKKWFAVCNLVTVSTLTKLRSDHFPILVEFKNDDCTFVSQFKLKSDHFPILTLTVST